MKSYFLVFYSLRRPIMNNLQEKVIRAMVDMYGFYSIEELSEMTEISISSIKRSLKDITKFIEDYDLHGGDRSAERKYFGST
jgi:transcriptional antiterminator